MPNIIDKIRNLVLDYYESKEDLIGHERLGQYIINRMPEEDFGGMDLQAIFYERNNVKAYQMIMDAAISIMEEES